MRSHEWIDRRSLALARVVADKIEQDPSLIETARNNLRRWLAEAGGAALPAHLEWQAILDREPLDRILEILRADTEEARRLRQSMPFAGVLTADERRRIFEEHAKAPA